MVLGNAQVVQHMDNGRGHQRRSAQVILSFFRFRMFLQIVIKKNLMDKSFRRIPVIIGLWI